MGRPPIGLTRLSKPPPRRSTAPICTDDVATGGPLTGGPRSRFNRSPRRSPCVGITAGCSEAGAPTGVASGLSALSLLQWEAEVNIYILVSKKVQINKIKGLTIFI